MNRSTQTQPGKNLLKRYPILAFFILAYLFFFVALMFIGGFLKLVSVSPTVMSVLIALASWTPNLAAVVVMLVNGGSNETI